MRLLRYFLVVMGTWLTFYAAPVFGVTATPPEPLLPQSPLVISAYSFAQDGTPIYLELYNNSSSPQLVQGWSVELKWGGLKNVTVITSSSSIPLTSQQTPVYIPPQGYTVVSFDGAVVGDQVQLQVSGIEVEPLNFIEKVSLVNEQYRPYERLMTASTVQTPQRLNRGANGYTSTYTAEDRGGPYVSDWYMPAENTPVRIVEVLPNSATDCTPFETDMRCVDYVKLTTDETIDLGTIRVRTGATTSATIEGILTAGSFAVVSLNLTNTGGDVWLEDVYGLARYESSLVHYGDSSNRRGQGWSQDDTGAWRWTAYPTPYNTPNQFTDGSPVNYCDTLRLSEIAANTTTQFIELYNAGTSAMSLRGCQILTNRSQTVKYVFPEQTLQPGEFTTVDVAKTELALTKTTSGTVFVVSSDGQVEVDARSYENLSENTSFALVDGVWQQTFAVTPGDENVYQQYPACAEGYVRNMTSGRCNKVRVAAAPTPCRSDQYRSAETNRCRNIVSTASVLTPCKPNQYRSQETNRCRNIASSTSSLTPCKPGQVRNPTTNRCRSTATQASSLKPCAPGQERNPDTNRCRKVVSLGDTDAGFKVVDTEIAKDAAASWFALGGVGLLAFGYAGWEWRREVYGAFVKVYDALPFGK